MEVDPFSSIEEKKESIDSNNYLQCPCPAVLSLHTEVNTTV